MRLKNSSADSSLGGPRGHFIFQGNKDYANENSNTNKEMVVFILYRPGLIVNAIIELGS